MRADLTLTDGAGRTSSLRSYFRKTGGDTAIVETQALRGQNCAPP